MQPIRTLLSLCLALLCVAPAFAADVPEAAYTGDIDQLVAEGWVETSPGIYQRTIDGHHQTLAYGNEGPRLELGWLDSQIALLIESFELSGSAEIAMALQDLEARRDEVSETLRRSTTSQQIGNLDLLPSDPIDPIEPIDPIDPGCTVTHTVDATAAAGNSGPRAAATTSFNDTCGRSATVYCHSYARAYSGTIFTDGTQADGPRTVYGSGSCSVSREVPGDNNCFANSTSQVQFLDDVGTPLTFFDRASTNSCAPMTVSIGTNDSTSPYLAPGDCVTLDFFASSNRSTATYNWNLNDQEYGTGTTFSKTFCNTYNSNYDISGLYVLHLSGTAESESADDSLYFDVTYQGTGLQDPKCEFQRICVEEPYL